MFLFIVIFLLELWGGWQLALHVIYWEGWSAWWGWENAAWNLVMIGFWVIFVLAGLALYFRQRSKILRKRSRFLFVFSNKPLTPKCKKVLKALGLAFLFLSGLFLLSIIATFVNPIYSAGVYFVFLIGRVYTNSELVLLLSESEAVLAILSSIVWLLEAIFFGFVIAAVVNYIGLGKKD